MQNLNKKNLFLLLWLAVLSVPQSVAGPSIKICIQAHCKPALTVELSDTCWANVKALFKANLSTDKDEQDNIVNAIALIESEIYNSLAQSDKEGHSASYLYADNGSRNSYLNYKTYLGLLLDEHLVTRHYLRKTISKQNWAGITSMGLLIQSLTDSNKYLLEKSDKLAKSPIISPYHP